MRRGFITLGVLIIAGSAPALASASAPDVTAGTGKRVIASVITQTVHVNATSENGLNPRGQILFDQAAPPFLIGESVRGRAVVTCHKVIGRQAVVGGFFTQPLQFPTGRAQSVFVRIEDESAPGNPDDLLVSIFNGPVPTECPTPPSFESDVTAGNFVVLDR
jgi:hypothetical protein